MQLTIATEVCSTDDLASGAMVGISFVQGVFKRDIDESQRLDPRSAAEIVTCDKQSDSRNLKQRVVFVKLSSSRDSKSLSALPAIVRSLRLAVSGAVVVANLVSCGRLGDPGATQTYRLPWPDAAGEVSLQDVEVRTLTDPTHFSGATARILVEPGESSGQLAGETPVGRFVKTKSGTILPADFISLQAVTVYAHQERLHDLDALAGTAGAITWPLSLGIEVRIVNNDGVVKNNAIYDAKLNSLLLVPYDQNHLPVSLSPGILAHEHFHIVFQSLVMSRAPDSGLQTACQSGVVRSTSAKATEAGNARDREIFGTPDVDHDAKVHATAKAMPPRVYNAFLLRAMNEGFADYWGWLYSNDESFLAKSLPTEEYARRLDFGPGRLPTESSIREQLVDSEKPEALANDGLRAHKAYTLGSQYARFLRKLVSDLMRANAMSEKDAKLAVARALVKSLPILADAVSTKYSSEFISPNFIVKPLLQNLPKMSRQVCARMNDFFAPEVSFLKPQGCAAFNLPDPVTDGSLENQPAPAPAPAPTPTPTPKAKSAGAL